MAVRFVCMHAWLKIPWPWHQPECSSHSRDSPPGAPTAPSSIPADAWFIHNIHACLDWVGGYFKFWKETLQAAKSPINLLSNLFNSSWIIRQALCEKNAGQSCICCVEWRPFWYVSLLGVLCSLKFPPFNLVVKKNINSTLHLFYAPFVFCVKGEKADTREGFDKIQSLTCMWLEK